MSLAPEQELAGLLGEAGVTTFVLRDLGNGEEGDLHTLKQTDDGHEDEEEDDGNASGNTFPHGSLAAEESRQGDSQGKTKDAHGQKEAEPEEDCQKPFLGGSVGLDGLAGKLGNNHGDKVGAVQETGELDEHGNPESEDGEPVVDVVKHAVRGVDLRVELTDHAG